jgi:hypothetical protein
MGPIEQACLAGSAVGRVEQAAAMARSAEQPAVTGRAAEHGDFVVLVATIGHIEQASALALESLTSHIDLPRVSAAATGCAKTKLGGAALATVAGPGKP